MSGWQAPAYLAPSASPTKAEPSLARDSISSFPKAKTSRLRWPQHHPIQVAGGWTDIEVAVPGGFSISIYLKIVILSGASLLLGTRSRRTPRVTVLPLLFAPFLPQRFEPGFSCWKRFQLHRRDKVLRGPSDAKRATNISIALCIWGPSTA